MAGELMNERRGGRAAGHAQGCAAGARSPSCLRVWMWSREAASLLF